MKIKIRTRFLWLSNELSIKVQLLQLKIWKGQDYDESPIRLFFLSGWSLLWTKAIIKPAYVLIMSSQSISSKEYKKRENYPE